MLYEEGPWLVAGGGNHVPREVPAAGCGQRPGAWCTWCRAAGMSRRGFCLVMAGCAAGELFVAMVVGRWWHLTVRLAPALMAAWYITVA